MTLSPLFAFLSAGVCCLFCISHLIAMLMGKRRSFARWVFSGGMLFLGIESLASGLSLSSGRVEGFLFWQQIRLVIQSFLPAAWLLFSLTYARGEARRFLVRWRLGLILFIALPGALAVFYYDDFILFRQVAADGKMAIFLGWPGQVTHLLVIIGATLSMMNLERTYRAAVGTLRWQVKYMLLGFGVLFAARFYTSSQALLFANVQISMDAINSIGLFISSVLILRSLTRKGHFEIELYPSHAVLSNSLTVLLAGLYLFIVGVLAKIVSFVGGDVAFPLKALGILVSLALLATLLQSDRFRLNVKQFVSRHFKRSMYDYREVWRRFTEETASHVRQPELCEALAKLISETFDALSVSIWLLDGGRSKLTLEASTVHRGSIDSSADTIDEAIDSMIISCEETRRPFDLERNESPWALRLKEANQKQFPHGGDRIGIPMMARDTLLGVIIVGDRVGGAVFTEQEYDILNSVGTHAASSLLNLQLSGKLAETRELEAFQTMATFFAHDLKNAASTLGIMVKNLPIHWENPEFRADALRGISKTGQRINQMVTGLSSVREKMKVEPAPVPIDAFSESVLAFWQAPEGVSLEKDLRSGATVPIDSEQLSKVLLNLLINSAEAMNGSGSIRVATDTRGDWAALSVSDTGCGMSEAFLRKSLFRPFKTTKKTGLGIGMFQSKLIVEAHKGRFEVESQEGAGTTFTILLSLEAGEA